MAEAGTIVGVISLGIQVCSGITAYYSSIRDAKADVLRMLELVGRLSSHLEAIQHLLNKEHGHDPVIISRLSEAGTSVRDAVLKLKKYLDKLHKTSLNGQMSMSTASRLFYPFRESTVAKLKETCIIASDGLSAAVNLLLLDANNASHTSMAELSEGLRKIALMADETAQDTRIIRNTVVTAHTEELQLKTAAKSRELWEWLSPIGEHSRNAHASCLSVAGRQEATAKAIIRSQEFEDWQDQRTPWLWCTGPKGVGKTMCVSSIIEHMLSGNAESPGISVTYIYCNYRNVGEQTLGNLIGTVLQQLLQPTEANVARIEQLRKQYNALHARPSPQALLEILEAATQTVSRSYLLIDAVDELLDTTALSFLSALRQQCPALNVFAWSRHQPPASFTEEPSIVSIRFKADIDSIAAYVQQRLDSSPQIQALLKRDTSLAATFVPTIVDRTKSIFLLAFLYMESLSQGTTLRALKFSMRNLPQELSDAFEEAIERISQQDSHRKALGMRVLSWVFYLAEPLKVNILARFLAIQPGDQYLDVDGVEEEELLLQVSGGLVSIDAARKVSFIHFSVQEFFFKNATRVFGQNGGYNDIVAAMSTYLAFPWFPNSAPDYSLPNHLLRSLRRSTRAPTSEAPRWIDIADLKSLGRSERLDLCEELRWSLWANKEEVKLVFKYLFHCTRRCTDEAILDHLVQLLSRPRFCAFFTLLENKLADIDVSYLRASSIYSASDGYHRQITDIVKQFFSYPIIESSGLIPAAAIGSVTLFNRLLLTYTDPRFSEPSYGRTSLHVAALHGSLDIARTLLKFGVDVDSEDKFGRTPLLYAITQNDLEMVRLLLEHDADVDFIMFKNERTQHAWKFCPGDSHSTILLNGMPNRGTGTDAQMPQSQPAHQDRAVDSQTSKLVRLLIKKETDTDTHRQRHPTPLIEAIRSKSLEVVKLLLEYNADVNLEDGWQQTPLHEAVVQESPELVHILVHHGAKANVYHQCKEQNFPKSFHAHDRCRQTPLTMAVSKKSVALVSSFLNCDISLNAQDGHDRTPLMQAACDNALEVLHLLLESGCDINAVGKSGYSALAFAVLEAGPEVIATLLSHGADVTCVTTSKDTMVHLAAQRRFPRAFQVLLAAGADINGANADGDSPLHEAARWRNSSIAETLLESGINVNAQNSSGATALHVAAGLRHENAGIDSMVELLVSRGADITLRDHCGETALHKVIHRGLRTLREHEFGLAGENADPARAESFKETAAYLLQHYIQLSEGAELAASLQYVNVLKNRDGMTRKLDYPQDSLQFLIDLELLCIAIENQMCSLVEVLLQHGCPLRHQSTTRSPLRAAVEKRSLYLTTLLLHHGASIRDVHWQQSSLIPDLVSTDDFDILNLLIQHGASLDSCSARGLYPLDILFSSEESDIELGLSTRCALLLLNAGATRIHRLGDLRWTEHDENVSILMYGWAHMCGNATLSHLVFRWLVAHGADLGAVSKDGKTALHYAASGSQAGNCALLLEHGVNPNIQDENGCSALHCAASGDVVQILLEYGADLNMQENQGRTPLHCRLLARQAMIYNRLGGLSWVHDVVVLIRNGGKVFCDQSEKQNDYSTLLELLGWIRKCQIYSYPRGLGELQGQLHLAKPLLRPVLSVVEPNEKCTDRAAGRI